MIDLFRSTEDKLGNIVKQFTDTVDQLESLEGECMGKISNYEEEINELHRAKEVQAATHERAAKIRESINKNILGVK